jgi:predicted PolB exonuclease-like 3'-5' exonuclease
MIIGQRTMNILVFDIETIPDVESGKKIHDLNGLSDAEVAQAMFTLQRDKTGRDFLPHHLQRICAISLVLRTPDKITVWSLGDEQTHEAEIIQRFFDGLDRYSPTLISWNGSGFDLPVLHYRSLLHNIQASRYWENGDDDNSFKWNNYLNRYHDRHTDLMDVLAGYTGRANAPLDEVATMLGYPGKMGMSGAKVWDEFQAKNIAGIRNYCETDVLNTYLVYLRYQLVRGRINTEQLKIEQQLLRDTLANENKAHLTEFLHAWNEQY